MEMNSLENLVPDKVKIKLQPYLFAFWNKLHSDCFGTVFVCYLNLTLVCRKGFVSESRPFKCVLY